MGSETVCLFYNSLFYHDLNGIKENGIVVSRMSGGVYLTSLIDKMYLRCVRHFHNHLLYAYQINLIGETSNRCRLSAHRPESIAICSD